MWSKVAHFVVEKAVPAGVIPFLLLLLVPRAVYYLVKDPAGAEPARISAKMWVAGIVCGISVVLFGLLMVAPAEFKGSLFYECGVCAFVSFWMAETTLKAGIRGRKDPNLPERKVLRAATLITVVSAIPFITVAIWVLYLILTRKLDVSD